MDFSKNKRQKSRQPAPVIHAEKPTRPLLGNAHDWRAYDQRREQYERQRRGELTILQKDGQPVPQDPALARKVATAELKDRRHKIRWSGTVGTCQLCQRKAHVTWVPERGWVLSGEAEGVRCE